ncbi:hypothetical protein BgiBS90_025253 [Biomphalaria glabrata]|nr:hypothetical protein BgiBS90_025253 [Biomphalaria glabrata]
MSASRPITDATDAPQVGCASDVVCSAREVRAAVNKESVYSDQQQDDTPSHEQVRSRETSDRERGNSLS